MEKKEVHTIDSWGGPQGVEEVKVTVEIPTEKTKHRKRERGENVQRERKKNPLSVWIICRDVII